MRGELARFASCTSSERRRSTRAPASARSLRACSVSVCGALSTRVKCSPSRTKNA